MNDFVTVLTAQYPQQLWIIRGRLESEGIECFLKDELTVQSNNLWSNAVGGVKLQVQNQDVERAVELLTELGYLKQETKQSDDLLIHIDRKIASIPFLKKFNSANRIVIIILLLIFLITTFSYLILKPSALNMLTKEAWYVDKIYYNHKLVGPKTIEIHNLPGEGNIDFSQFGEMLSFDQNSLKFPGINGRTIKGTWKYDGNSVELKVDTLMYILNGSYKIDISDTQLTLTSATTVITAHQ